jgi:hypothetical protein
MRAAAARRCAVLNVTISGSFHRHLAQIEADVLECRELGVQVLSPADPRVVGAVGAFLFVASDPVRSVRLVQDKHLEAIRASDFLWLVTPDGYVGQSASLELGFAIAAGVPILSTSVPDDLTLRQYVGIVPNLRVADNPGSEATLGDAVVMDFSELERLRIFLQEILSGHSRVMENYFDAPTNGFYHSKKDMRVGDPSKASTATCVLSLHARKLLRTEPWKDNWKTLLEHLVAQSWTSAELPVDNLLALRPDGEIDGHSNAKGCKMFAASVAPAVRATLKIGR